MQRMVLTVFFLSTALAGTLQVIAQDSKTRYAPLEDESSNYEMETIHNELDNPGGLAIRSGSAKTGPHEIFIAESGAGRVIRVATDEPQQIDEVITGFSQGSFGDDPTYRVGPLGLAFLTRSKLIVAGGSADTGKNTIGVFALPEDGAPLTAVELDHSVGPIKTGASTDQGEPILFGLASTDIALFTTWAEESQGWVLKSGIESNRLAYLQPFVSTKNATGVGRPTGIAVIPSPRPPFLVVAQMGSFETPHDSLLSFFIPSSGDLAMSLPTGLHDIIALAYSPSGQLYALDFSWADEAAGGVYRLDDARVDGRQACRPVRIAAVTRPAALAFAPDGSLYVAAFGEGENARQGLLVKITGEF